MSSNQKSICWVVNEEYLKGNDVILLGEIIFHQLWQHNTLLDNVATGNFYLLSMITKTKEMFFCNGLHFQSRILMILIFNDFNI